ncbi:uncharacterized protein B0J16DRAFT_409840 [Fusarium flagelliforme]|uniref:Uncharacterized protein n=1 Tax=Fusarium flagelliforme TaxID=2675880 RepID=A0A395N690_9HYPO|nr:uncharacterized protein B0J16DRAFT_409840 [Fusarium flagelliforme]KAH7198308.1 hypothetical protein B0J16DRAFT_409840 [Fusarium flagelliforme]RFN55293.1 hypothetical protein FIE12Z_546 [Fusarium flagelliforme]
MAHYSLRVNLDEKRLKQWSSVPDMKLCFAMEISNGGDKTYHNMVACTNDIGTSTQITWTDNYKIAANVITITTIAPTTPNAPTTTISTTKMTNMVDVKFGTKTTVTKDSNISTGFSSDAPSKGFLFTNEIECSTILYCEIDGKFVPVYTSPGGSLSPGSSEEIIPNRKVYVWFSDDAKSSTMIETMGRAEGIQFEFGGNSDKIVTLDMMGNWTLS